MSVINEERIAYAIERTDPQGHELRTFASAWDYSETEKGEPHWGSKAHAPSAGWSDRQARMLIEEIAQRGLVAREFLFVIKVTTTTRAERV